MEYGHIILCFTCVMPMQLNGVHTLPAFLAATSSAPRESLGICVMHWLRAQARRQLTLCIISFNEKYSSYCYVRY